MITLYDIPSQNPGKSFSPNVFKARLTLGFKGLAFKTEWVEMSDIQQQMKELGAEPTTIKPDGSPMYTLPVIFDDATGKVVSDSLKIAEYLEATYPDTPTLFPGGGHAPIHLLNEYFFPTVIRPGLLAFLSNVMFKLNPPSMAEFRATREKLFGKTLEEAVPRGETKDAMVKAVKDAFSKLAAMYSANGGARPYFFGDEPSYADLIVVAFLIWIRVGLGPENPEWKVISEEWDGGKWGNLVKLLDKYNVRT